MHRLILVVLLLPLSFAAAAEKPPVSFHDDFSKGASHWQPSDAAAWKVIDADKGKAYSQFRRSKYKPPHRSPFNFALVKDLILGDVDLEVRARSTVKDYPHRDLCLFFGYQDPAHFYYVHLGKRTDDHANQIFIVNDAARKKISTKTSKGTPWTDGWHHLRLVRRVGDGTINVYYDDMKNPVMTAKDKTFTWGQVGIGSFDDTGDWTDVKINGRLAEKK